MLYGIGPNSEKFRATPDAPPCRCELCGEQLVAKCGQIMTWHWAHRTKENCDSWSEGETEWHLGWKGVFPSDWIEIVKGNHRADVVVGGSGRVLELQHSYISCEEIQEREEFYGKMAWVFDATEAAKAGRLKYWRAHLEELEPHWNENHCRFRWSRMRQTIRACRKPLFIDAGPYLIHVYHLYEKGGYGRMLNIFDFAEVFGLKFKIDEKTNEWQIKKFIDPLNFDFSE